MNGPESIRGQPLLVLAVLLGAWLVGRVLLWAPPFPTDELVPPTFAPRIQAAEIPTLGIALPGGQAAARSPQTDRDSQGSHPPGAGPSTLATRLFFERDSEGALHADSLPEAPAAHRAADDQVLMAAAYGFPRLPVEPGRAPTGSGRYSIFEPASGRIASADGPLLGTRAASPKTRGPRLSGDAWVLWREGSGTPAAPGISAYGRSQAGAVLRYSLLPVHALLPTLYARVSRTIEGSRQGEVAAGLSLRSVAGVPVDVAAEARVTETSSGREVRPAAFAVTRLPRLALPLDFRGETYLQAGYVGGRFKTAFVDGQARVDRRVVRLGEDQELRAGLAAWGGAQKGAGRLDAGPSAAVAFKLGGTVSRITVDYRLRVAGGAAPSSGPAVTFSAGF